MRISTTIIQKLMISKDIIVSMTTSGCIVTRQQLLLMVTSSLHVLVWKEDGRRIVAINISAGDDCPGEWRKATQSGVSFRRVASDSLSQTCSSANFSTNGISYQRVCGELEDTTKEVPWHFMGHTLLMVNQLRKVVSGLYITYSSNPRKHIWTYAAGRGERYNNR